MAIDIKRFGGVLNTDDREQDLLPMQHKDGRNIRFYGGQQGLTAENVFGNYLIENAYLPSGTNECIGAFYDQVKRRIIWFNYNSNGDNGIYQLLIQSGDISKLFVCGTDSATDIFNFSLDYPVCSAAIVYRTEGDGDLLYWTDGHNRPRYLNLDTVSSLAPFTEAMINAAKNAPLSPPTFPAAAGTNGALGYFSDATVTYNLVRDRYFRFSYRWVYKNGEKSTLSPISIVPLPFVFDPTIQVVDTTNNYIKFVVYSPDEEDYKAIEIFGQLFNGVTWGDFFIIDQLDREQYNIPVNSSFTYSFYNNGSYVFVAPEVSDLYFDWLPDKANALELLNGNVLIYGGITDGYDNLTREEVDVTITSSLVSLTPFFSTLVNVSPAFKWATQEKFGLVYFDDRGKTNGVVSFVADPIDTTDFAVQTDPCPSMSSLTAIQVPKISASINHTPPTWATSYQWARVDLTPKFLHWATNDYQVENEYLYLGIEALIQMNARAGFLPSYEFAVGDRVRILAKMEGDNTTTAFSTQNDYPILDVVQRIMTSPASLGAFVKIPKPSSFPTPAYSPAMLIEIYTPKPTTPENQQLYYEWGQKYDIYELAGNRYHMGQTQNQTGAQPALFEWTNGDVYVKSRKFYLAVPIENNTTYSYLYMMDANFNDYAASSANQNARAWTINENAKTEYNQVLVRWGGKYQSGTNLNDLNRFRPSDYDEVDRAKGAIQRFKTRDKILRVFQDRGVGQYGVYARFIQNNEGVPELVTTKEIITTNNIQYYQGIFGLGGYPTNLCSGAIADYFDDITTGRSIRLSTDGMTDLGLLYKGQFYLSSLVTPYNKELLRSNGSVAKVMKFWDSFENQAHTILQAGSDTPGAQTLTLSPVIVLTNFNLTFGGTPVAGYEINIELEYNSIGSFQYTVQIGDTISDIIAALVSIINPSAGYNAVANGNILEITGQGAPAVMTGAASAAEYVWNITTVTNYNYSFNELRNAFCSFYDFYPEWALSADDKVYSWKNGQLWKHDSSVDYCNFYDEQFDAFITLVFNNDLVQKKSWQSIAEVASDTWSCPEIYTNTMSYGTTRQQTTLVSAELVKQEQMPTSAIKRDSNSRGGKVNGQFMKGNYMVVKFQKENASEVINLSEILVYYNDSPLTKT